MARVIRGPGDPVVPGEVYDAEQQAERITAEARAEAARIVAEANASRDAIHAEAAREGAEAGRAQLAASLLEAAARRDRALADAEGAVAEVACAVAERLLSAELESSPDRILPVVRDVLTRARRAQRVRVRVHPDDADALRGAVDVLPRGALVEEDPQLARGGCVVETDLGTLDGRLEVRLAALQRALTPSE